MTRMARTAANAYQGILQGMQPKGTDSGPGPAGKHKSWQCLAAKFPAQAEQGIFRPLAGNSCAGAGNFHRFAPARS
jgi:hypothetical protein